MERRGTQRAGRESVGETVGLNVSGRAKCWSEWQDLNLRPPRPEQGALAAAASQFHQPGFRAVASLGEQASLVVGAVGIEPTTSRV